MRAVMLFAAIAAMALLSASAVLAEPCYLITLENGNTITANQCRFEGGSFIVKFPAGESRIRARDVKFITTTGDMPDYFQAQGAQPQAKATVATAAPAYTTNSAVGYASPLYQPAQGVAATPAATPKRDYAQAPQVGPSGQDVALPVSSPPQPAMGYVQYDAEDDAPENPGGTVLYYSGMDEVEPPGFTAGQVAP